MNASPVAVFVNDDKVDEVFVVCAERKIRARSVGGGEREKARERRLAVTEPGVAVGEQEMLEIAPKVTRERCLQTLLYATGIVPHQFIRHESERLAVPHDCIADREQAAVSCDIERRLFGTECIDREGEDVAGEALAVFETPHGAGFVKMVQARLMAPDRCVEGTAESITVTVMKPIGEIDVRGRRAVDEPFKTFIGYARVDQYCWLCVGKIIGMNRCPYSLVKRRPVINLRQYLLHASSLCAPGFPIETAVVASRATL